MSDGRIILTREGRDKLCTELKYLKNEKRREIANSLAEARAHGDLSENAEYDAAKEAQAMNEKRIAELEDTLMRAELIDESKISKSEALLGNKIKVKDQKTSEEFVYMLVSEEESDFDSNKISVSSLVGRALLGHRVGDIVEIQAPAGMLRYGIIDIT